MEYVQSPKYFKGNKMYSLIEKPRNVFAARKFCQEEGNGKLYQPKQEYLEIARFAEKYFVYSFYMGVSDEETENIFKYGDGTLVPNSYSHWYEGQPDNFVPDLNRFCDNEDQDHIISNNSKWYDTIGFRYFPFICETEVEHESSPMNDVCAACHVFISIMNINFTPDIVLPFFNNLCQEKLPMILDAYDNVCVAGGNLVNHLVGAIQNQYLLNYQICNIFQNCNISEEYEVNDKCSNCKFILQQSKNAIMHLNKNQAPKYTSLPMQLALQYLCQALNLDCNDTNFLSILKKVSAYYFTKEHVAEICTILSQC